MSARSTVLAQFEEVAKEQGKKLAPLSDNLVLLDSGLDSLCFAIIVARLEDALGIDPFSSAEDGRLPLTLGDFVKFYDDAAK
jgi:acyl carrier protein